MLSLISLNSNADSSLIIKSNKVHKQTISGSLKSSGDGFSLRAYDEVKKEFIEYNISEIVGYNEQINLKKYIEKKVLLTVTLASQASNKSKGSSSVRITFSEKNHVISKIYSVELI
jgi:hypothetical protein